jgi:O-methyltransferase involved in polyketide biosynthesis
VPVDFEAGQPWREGLAAAGFDASRPTVVASAGVSMYLTRAATAAVLREAAGLAPGSTLVMTFHVPLELVEEAERAQRLGTEHAARAAGSPFISFFTPADLLALAREAGFARASHVSAASLAERYFAGRLDGLRPSSSEQLLVATTG